MAAQIPPTSSSSAHVEWAQQNVLTKPGPPQNALDKTKTVVDEGEDHGTTSQRAVALEKDALGKELLWLDAVQRVVRAQLV